ncbi:MAG TPA: FAD binding domain-containing protein, partial [Gemmatimonadales bacterium]|nr:FAD binding domain-containing protein [Gemmatimonadales bacterium]
MNVKLPGTVPEALDMLASDGAAVPIAGGTDLLVHWPVRVEAHERTYVDLSRLDSLRPLRWTADELLLGGLTTYWDVIRDALARAEFPLLVNAARQVGAIQIQARGTWAGNIVNASPAADGVPVLMAYDAVVVLESRRGREEVPLDRFYSGYKEMKRRPDQLVVAIRLPR